MFPWWPHSQPRSAPPPPPHTFKINSKRGILRAAPCLPWQTLKQKPQIDFIRQMSGDILQPRLDCVSEIRSEWEKESAVGNCHLNDKPLSPNKLLPFTLGCFPGNKWPVTQQAHRWFHLSPPVSREQTPHKPRLVVTSWFCHLPRSGTSLEGIQSLRWPYHHMLVPRAVQIPGAVPIHSEFRGVKIGQLLFLILEPSSWAVHFDSDFWVRHKMMYFGY